MGWGRERERGRGLHRRGVFPKPHAEWFWVLGLGFRV